MDMQIEHGSKVKWSVSRSSGEALSQCARGPGFLGMGEALLPRLEKSHASMPHQHLHASLQMRNLVCTCFVTSVHIFDTSPTPATCYN
jgi:hypothetical protein